MNYIVKKAGISVLTGAANVLGAWVTKLILEETKSKIVNRTKERKEEMNPT